MTNRNYSETNFATAAGDPRSSASLVPMLIGGLVMIVVGMLAVFAFV